MDSQYSHIGDHDWALSKLLRQCVITYKNYIDTQDIKDLLENIRKIEQFSSWLTVEEVSRIQKQNLDQLNNILKQIKESADQHQELTFKEFVKGSFKQFLLQLNSNCAELPDFNNFVSFQVIAKHQDYQQLFIYLNEINTHKKIDDDLFKPVICQFVNLLLIQLMNDKEAYNFILQNLKNISDSQQRLMLMEMSDQQQQKEEYEKFREPQVQVNNQEQQNFKNQRDLIFSDIAPQKENIQYSVPSGQSSQVGSNIQNSLQKIGEILDRMLTGSQDILRDSELFKSHGSKLNQADQDLLSEMQSMNENDEQLIIQQIKNNLENINGKIEEFISLNLSQISLK